MAEQAPKTQLTQTTGGDPHPLTGLAILLLGKKWQSILEGKKSRRSRAANLVLLQFVSRGALVVASSTLTLLLALIGGIYAKEIYETTGPWLQRFPSPISATALVLTFWIGCFLTIWLYSGRAREQRLSTEELNLRAYRILEPTVRSIEETLIAARHFASPALFNSHARHFAELNKVVEAATASGQADKLADAIRKGLNMIATMASRYARAPDTASYGANVMLVASEPYPPKLLDRLIFSGRRNNHSAEFYKYATGACGNILYLPTDLLVPALESHLPRSVPDIALPVPQPDGDGVNPDVIPGAPFALFYGSVSVHRDTLTLADDYPRFAQSVREEMQRYFTTGDGKDVRSFASFRLGTSEAPVGVLNIDSNAVNVLGIYDDSASMTTFLALLTPVMLLLRDPVSKYAALTYNDRFE